MAFKSLLTLSGMSVENFVPYTPEVYNLTDAEILDSPPERLTTMVDSLMIMVKTGLSAGAGAGALVWTSVEQMESDFRSVLQLVRQTFKSFKSVMKAPVMEHAFHRAVDTDFDSWLRAVAERAAPNVNLIPTTMDIPPNHSTVNWICPRIQFTQTIMMCNSARQYQFHYEVVHTTPLPEMSSSTSSSSMKHGADPAVLQGGKKARKDQPIVQYCYQFKKDGKCEKMNCPYAHVRAPADAGTEEPQEETGTG
jgi:hypothetical protein